MSVHERARCYEEWILNYETRLIAGKMGEDIIL
jgi:hypothetical protein